MTFRENLLKKIKIDKISEQVIASIGTPDSGKKIDGEAMRDLLEIKPYKLKRERDLDLFILEKDKGEQRILVLDNDLAIYDTTAEDVAMRKSPAIKEMLSIRNVIKILNDGDVVVSRKEESVRTIQKEYVDMLDLSFEMSDIDDIENDGSASLNKAYSEGVIESLTLFAEILSYRRPPKNMKISNCFIIGAAVHQKIGEVLYGPVVIYSYNHNELKLIEDQIGSFDKEKLDWMHHVVMGSEKATIEGPLVFQYLKEAVIKTKT
ncbi:MAG TPA: hypothetical protein QF571_03820 [Desulfobacterales bacterium]|jgi:hypothetical protein|nr:hypothetical protein [Desulfobacterales bacterium]